MKKWWIRIRIALYRLGVRLGFVVPEPIFYIGGSETLPPPLSAEEEAYLLAHFYTDHQSVRRVLI